MSQSSSVRLFVANPASGQAQSFKGYLERSGGYQNVDLMPLTELPALGKKHAVRQMLLNEQMGLKPQLESCLDFIQLAENNITSFGHELPELRRERDSLELRLEVISRELAKGARRNG